MFGVKTKIKKIFGAYLSNRSKKIESLSPSLWDLEVSDEGCLEVGGNNVAQLAKEYGTPLYIVNEEKARSNCRQLLSAFGSAAPNLEIFFSYKTNPVPGMIRIFHEEGVGAEVISDYELWLAFKMGVPPDKIIFNGLSKSVESLTLAVDRGIRLINIDSFTEIEKLEKISEERGRRVEVGIRVITGLGWGGQFGFSIDSGEAFKAVKRIIRSRNLALVGLHFHLGTLIKSPRKYLSALDVVFRFLSKIKKKMGIEIKYLDTGGGYGIPTVKAISDKERKILHKYFVQLAPPEDSEHPSPEDYATAIGEKIGEQCNNYELTYPTVFVEPGRLLSSSAQILLLKVCDLKQRKGMPMIAIMDGGSVNVAYPTMGEYREVFVANRMKEQKKELYKIVGSLCSIGDILYQSKYLPEIQRDDYLAIMDAGAYFVPNANNFSFPRPAIVIVSKEGHRLTRERETFDFMFSNDRI